MGTKLRAGDLAASLTVSVDSGGEYYVRVVGRDDDLETQYSVAATVSGCDVTPQVGSTAEGTTSTTTTPTVNTDLTCPQNDDYEPNDSYLEAAAISNDGTLVSGVLCGKEFDVFAVDVCEGGEVTADLVLAAVSVDKVNLVLLDEAGKIVDKTKLRAGDLAASLTVSVDSGGEYYVRVVGRDDDLETPDFPLSLLPLLDGSCSPLLLFLNANTPTH